MTAGIAPQTNNQLEQERARVSRLLDEVAQMCESDILPTVFFGEMLRRLLDAIGAVGGAVWIRASQGNVELRSQINFAKVSGVDRGDQAKLGHDALMKLAFEQGRNFCMPPNSMADGVQDQDILPHNPSDYLLLGMPIKSAEQVDGLIEIWQNPNRPPNTHGGFLNYMNLMADLCVRYFRNQRVLQLTTQQKLWGQLENFAQNVHGSLNPIEVAYQVANEGRRLIDCDRVSVAIRHGKNTRIEAISGADVVEKRSNLVVLMKNLCDSVLNWGEKLVYKGETDDSLPPKVVKALDDYLAESTSRLLVIMPLKQEKDGKESKLPPRSALVMESFESPENPDQLISRTEVIARHATSALHNAVEYRRIPMRFIWQPLATIQEGLGGPTKALMALATVLLCSLGTFLALYPYPLKMDATGNLQPTIRATMYSPIDGGKVNEFKVWPADKVSQNHQLAVLSDSQLEGQINNLRAEIRNAESERRQAEEGEAQANSSEKIKYANDKEKAQRTLDAKRLLLEGLIARTGADPNPGRSGYFYINAPFFTPEQIRLIDSARYNNHRKQWTVLNHNFREEWTNRAAKPSDPLIRLAAEDGPWEIEIKIPQKHIGQIQKAFKALQEKPENKKILQENPTMDFALDVDFLLRSDPTRTFKGKLYQRRIAPEALPNKEESDEAEPVVMATVSIDDEGISSRDRLTQELLLPGAGVHAKILCGDKPMYYSLFYGIWEFLYEKVIFFF